VTSDIVEVWLIGTDVSNSVLAELEALLDGDERERASTLLYPARRRQFVAAHGAVRVILGRRMDVSPESLRWRRGPHGKPELAGSGPQVSLSKSGSLAALAIAADRRVGVDIQRLLAHLDVTRMARRFYPPEEARFVSEAAGSDEQAERFTRLWARKEACVKVSGGRLLPGLRLTVRPAGAVRATCAAGADLAGSPASEYLVRDLRVPRGYRAAVAAEGSDHFSITRHAMYLGQRRYQLQPTE